jgi:uncharacterized DUF497 family protein
MAYSLPCDFEWDERKSDACMKERGFDFAAILPAFADPTRHIELDDRYEYGEERFRLFGQVERRLFVIVFALRGRTIRIISARKANRREQKSHGKGEGKA